MTPTRQPRSSTRHRNYREELNLRFPAAHRFEQPESGNGNHWAANQPRAAADGARSDSADDAELEDGDGTIADEEDEEENPQHEADAEDIDDDEDEDDEDEEEEGGIEEVPMEVDTPFDPVSLGLKEIGNLASWTVSSYKPGFGVQELRNDDTEMFWQSDGPQPHHINIHFSRLVSILSIRIFLNFEDDESYTPTRIALFAGTGYHDLIPFAQLDFAQPKGWIDVPLTHVGGGDDGTVLRTFLVQVKIVENHQNGKDTHVRGLKVYTKDERVGRVGFPALSGVKEKADGITKKEAGAERTWLLEPSWMGEPELR